MDNRIVNENWGMLGQEWAVELLREQINREQIRHAYLFCGSPGVGRRTLALRFAQALNCTNYKESGGPCNECRDCRQISAEVHPDLMITNAEVEDGTIKAVPVRELRWNLALKPYQARFRVAILPGFQRASEKAANALLKTLEEAPPQAVLILTADNPEQLLPTITSRCEILRLRPLSYQALEDALTNLGIDSEKAHLLAHISGGRPGLALNLSQDKDWLDRRREQFDDQSRLISASRVEKFEFAERLSKDKSLMRQTLLLWISYWRDVFLLASDSSIPISNTDRQAEIESLSRTMSVQQVNRLLQQLEKTVAGMEANVNSRLAAEVLLLDFPAR